MHPRTPYLLIDLVDATERLLREDAAFAHPSCKPDKLAALLAETRELAAKPQDSSEAPINDITVWLAQALDHVAREGRQGAPKKWIELARCFLPFVRTDLASAIGAGHLPDRDTQHGGRS